MDGRTEGRTDGSILNVDLFYWSNSADFFYLENQNLFQSLNLTDSCIEGA